MATVKELNEAIKTLIFECESHLLCDACPMEENCSRIRYDMGCISDWEEIKDGEQDG